MRRKTALQLHIEGNTFEAIGQKLGVTRQRAHQLVSKQLAETAAERKSLAGSALDTDLERLDFVLRSLAPRIERGDDKAAQAYIRALDRRAKLLGLDAPSRSEVSGPGGAPIAHEIASTETAALHARLAAAAARATRGADPGGTPPADPAGAAGD